MPVTTAAIGAAQGVLGGIQAAIGSAKAKRLRSQRRAYQTPEEIYKLLNATINNSQGDTKTRDFLTGQLNTSFGQMIGSATRLGADPNNLSDLFRAKISGMLQIGQEFHKSNLEAFGKVLSAYEVVAANKAAEQKSKEDILKDDILGAQQQAKDGLQNVAAGINTGLAGLSAAKSNELYSERTDALLGGLGSSTAINSGLSDLTGIDQEALLSRLIKNSTFRR